MTVCVESEALAELTQAIDAVFDQPQAQWPAAVQAALQNAFAQGNWIPPQQRQSDPDRYNRHILYADPQGRYTIVALVWRQGQFSPVHAHHTWCALTVVQGTLREHYYSWDAATETAHHHAWQLRVPGQGSSGHAGLHAIHRLGNPQGDEAISVHVYGVDSARVSTDVNHCVAHESYSL